MREGQCCGDPSRLELFRGWTIVVCVFRKHFSVLILIVLFGVAVVISFVVENSLASVILQIPFIMGS